MRSGGVTPPVLSILLLLVSCSGVFSQDTVEERLDRIEARLDVISNSLEGRVRQFPSYDTLTDALHLRWGMASLEGRYLAWIFRIRPEKPTISLWDTSR